MEQNNINIKKAFDEVFGMEDKYFGEWFIKSDNNLEEFLENLSEKEKFLKQLRYLFLYLESLETLKKQADSENCPACLMSRDIWYCTLLLMLVGLIDQHTKKEKNSARKTKRLKDRFDIVIGSLNSEEQRDFTLHYNGNKYKNIKELSSHLYETRTFFAHDPIMPRDKIPQDGFLGVDSDNIGMLFINMPYGRIFLYIVIALLRYLGYQGKLEIGSNKEFNSFKDMLRKT